MRGGYAERLWTLISNMIANAEQKLKLNVRGQHSLSIWNAAFPNGMPKQCVNAAMLQADVGAEWLTVVNSVTPPAHNAGREVPFGPP